MSTSQIVVHTTVHTAGLATTILAALGVGLGLLSLAWQAMSFRLSGSRVKVEIRAGATDGKHFATQAGMPTEEHLSILRSQGMTQPIFEVKVTNAGRSPTSRPSVELLLTGGLSLGGVYFPGAPKSPLRIEAESEASWYFDASFGLAAGQVMAKPDQPSGVRGQATVAGRDEPVISKTRSGSDKGRGHRSRRPGSWPRSARHPGAGAPRRAGTTLGPSRFTRPAPPATVTPVRFSQLRSPDPGRRNCETNPDCWLRALHLGGGRLRVVVI